MKKHHSCNAIAFILVWLNSSNFTLMIILRCFIPINNVKDLGPTLVRSGVCIGKLSILPFLETNKMFHDF